jgi:GT2 family glycosyltransferase/glycosyltransferase involved in cell wall biosynthesis
MRRPQSQPVSDPHEIANQQVLSGFFDPDWYAASYPDVRESKLDPLLHFMRYGLAERRDPNAFFDSAWYIERNLDVGVSGQHPLVHYLQWGAAELRDPHPRFDASYYVDEHPEAAGNPLVHHLRVGVSRGYLTEKPIDIRKYLPSGNPILEPPDDLIVDIVIPVYRGLLATRRCLGSVLADGALPLGRVIVVDDRSPEPKLSAYLERLAKLGRIILIKHKHNQGFIRSANAGMKAAGKRDVVLLNSDTEVPAGWLSRLAAQAYAKSRIATVSPMSNNATICSYPASDGGPIVFGLKLAGVDEQCRIVNAGRSVATPTTVGFCMYIRREALDQVGLFAAERFGRGYGEENDFCLRATANGWHHRIACDIFVYHQGSVSFGKQKQMMSELAMDLLLERFPHYMRDVAQHIKLDAIGPFRFSLTGALINSAGLPVILMVTHNLGGGIGRHIADVVSSVEGRAHVLLLESSANGIALSVPMLTGHPVLRLPAERLEDLVQLLRHCSVDRVHVHHLQGMDVDVLALIRLLGVPFDTTVHDYLAICPQTNLLPSPTGFYCNEPGPAGCNACIGARPSHGARDILSWRAERAWQFREADRVICPSADVVSRLKRFGLGSRAMLVPHQPVTHMAWPYRKTVAHRGRLRVAVLGVLADHKGARTVAAVAEMADSKTIEIHLIGYTESNFPTPALARVISTGPYQEADLGALINGIAPDVIWFPAAWPETFSFTLTAAIDAGIAIVATRVGAFPERLAGRRLTWLVDPVTSPTEWLSVFEQIRGVLSSRTVAKSSARRAQVPDFYATQYLRPAQPSDRRPLTRIRTSHPRPIIAVIPECFGNGAPTPCAYIRLLQPLDHPAIGQDFEVLLTDAKGVLNYRVDLIVTQRFAIPDVASADAIANHARNTKATLLYDLDDGLLKIPVTHSEADQLRPRAKTVRRMLGHANAVWVSTYALALSIRTLRRDAVVIPNGLDERLWSATMPHPSHLQGPARVLCMGTTTHERDFSMIIPALVRLKAEFGPEVEIDVIGVTSDSRLPSGINRIHLPQYATQSYPGFVSWMVARQPAWHIGLIPLLDTSFNRCKSSIKAMEYAALGMTSLASDMPVFRGSIADGPAGDLVANDHQAWYRALSWLVRNRTLRQSAGTQGHLAFLAQATLASQAETRRAAWVHLLQKPDDLPSIKLDAG